MLFTKCILHNSSPEDGLRISVMSRHTLSDGVTPDGRIIGRFDIHVPILGPSPKLIGRYYRNGVDWLSFEKLYLQEIRADKKVCIVTLLARLALIKDVTLLCIEETAVCCHRRLLAEECERLAPRLHIEHR